MFEKHSQQLAPRWMFLGRILRSMFVSGALIMVALILGVSGYHWIARLNWIDALLNASMILGGMGPVDQLQTSAAKLFASAYALFSGLVLVGATGIVLSPIMHRVLHKFHIDVRDLEPAD